MKSLKRSVKSPPNSEIPSCPSVLQQQTADALDLTLERTAVASTPKKGKKKKQSVAHRDPSDNADVDTDALDLALERTAVASTPKKGKKKKQSIAHRDPSDNADVDTDTLDLALETTTVASTPNKVKKKKRSAAHLDPSDKVDVDADNGEAMDGVLIEDDLNEPTMGEKLSSLNLVDSDKSKNHEKQESSPQKANPPSANSVHILLKQALHAEDRTLLLDCLYTQDDKVIANSVSLLSPTHVSKLLHSLLTIIDSRGAILACALPWLRSLLLQHASKIMSQESSLVALNSLYQVIESRNSTFQPALQLSSCLDSLYSGVVDDTSEDEKVIPFIYEDDDDSDEDDDEGESEKAMETDDEDSQAENRSYGNGGVSDLEEGDDMSD